MTDKEIQEFVAEIKAVKKIVDEAEKKSRSHEVQRNG